MPNSTSSKPAEVKVKKSHTCLIVILVFLGFFVLTGIGLFFAAKAGLKVLTSRVPELAKVLPENLVQSNLPLASEKEI